MRKCKCFLAENPASRILFNVNSILQFWEKRKLCIFFHSILEKSGRKLTGVKWKNKELLGIYGILLKNCGKVLEFF